MKSILIVCLLAAALSASALVASPEVAEAHVEPSLFKSNLTEQFKAFCHKYNKQYTPIEFAKRQAIFAKKLIEIAAHNLKHKNGEIGWKQAVNQFADETVEEVISHLGYDQKADNQTGSVDPEAFLAAHKQKRDIPIELDWRARGKTGFVKDQNRCGSCWAFATTGAMEACVAIYTNKLTFLSEQMLQDCMFSRQCSPGGGGGAAGIDWVIQHNGVANGFDYPYLKGDGQCHDTYWKAHATGRLHGSSEDFLKLMVYYGPVLIGLNADLLMSYGGGVIDDANYSKARNHAVLVVGYTTNCDGRGYQCWIIRNQWGTGWGEGGHFRVKMGQRVIGLGDDSDMPMGCTSD